MVRLYSYVGDVSEEHLDFLIDNLEEEWADDQDYYLNKDMIDTLEQNGADPALIQLLRQALGDKAEVEILWVDTEEIEGEEDEEA